MNPCIVLIGGSDPSGGAGIQADLHTLGSLGLRAQSVITAVTAQSASRFDSYESVSPEIFAKQLRSLKQSEPLFAKIGMIGDSRLIPVLQTWLEEAEPEFAILDPVLASSTGAALLDEAGLGLLSGLFPLVDLLTPNLPEAERLSGLIIRDLAGMRRAAERLLDLGARQVLMKGGHLRGEPCDLLIDAEIEFPFPGKRIDSKNTHGTGCTLASAILGYLSLGHDLVASIHLGRKKIEEKLRAKPS